jgi:hypothetical protein
MHRILKHEKLPVRLEDVDRGANNCEVVRDVVKEGNRRDDVERLSAAAKALQSGGRLPAFDCEALGEVGITRRECCQLFPRDVDRCDVRAEFKETAGNHTVAGTQI